MVTTNWDKFRLLLWKNWLLQWNHKWQLLIELLTPGLFAMLLVVLRVLIVPDRIGVTIYDQTFPIDNLSLFKHFIGLVTSKEEVIYHLMYSPNTSSVLDSIVKEAAGSLELTYSGVANSEELEYAMLQKNYLAGVEFDDSWADMQKLPQTLEFRLRFPCELRTSTLEIMLTWFTNWLFSIILVSGPRNQEEPDGGIPTGYLREGFLPVQHAISTAFISQSPGGSSSLPKILLQRYPYPEFIDDPLVGGLAAIMAPIILLCFLYPAITTVKYITAEKEMQLKEVMKIMGLPNWLHWMAWFVKAICTMGFACLLITFILTFKWVEGVAVFTHSSFTAIFFFLLIYAIASITLCFMLATFFSRATTASAVSGLLWFILYIPFTYFQENYFNLKLFTKVIWCLVSNVALGFGVRSILVQESEGEGLQWKNMFEPLSADDSLSISYVMAMMLVASVIHMLICLYTEQILPGNFGVPRKWNFPFKKSFWTGEHEYVGATDENTTIVRSNPRAFEAEPEGKNIGVQVKNLTKTFDSRTAVKGLSLNMYEDEITVLLGHNGAGKTTTISMLTGMFPPTSGTAIIHGSDIRTNMDGARQSLGICPQHNILFDDLTVRNHLVFYSRLKGLQEPELEAEVQKYIKKIDLEAKEHVASKNLSGGMRRKLSVCAAFCGGTKVVLCDEPSAGMDPAARRQLWDLLQSEKPGRTILLTTHFMDEADVLGDRIAIMSAGELKCHGTSFFLKKKFGSGYKLICVKKENCNSAKVTELLSKYIPGLEPEADVGAELSYLLSDEYSSSFEKMLANLEQHSNDLHLDGYGVSITSLEDVFMKVGAEHAEVPIIQTINEGSKEVTASGSKRDRPSASKADKKITISKVDRESESKVVKAPGSVGAETSLPQEDRSSQKRMSNGRRQSRESGDINIFDDQYRLIEDRELTLSQWRAMFLKKYLYSIRTKIMCAIQNIISIIFISLTIFVAANSVLARLRPMTMSLSQYPNTVTVLETKSIGSGSTEDKIAQQYQQIVKSYGSRHELALTGDADFISYILHLGKRIQPSINSRYIAAATIESGKITAWLNNKPLHSAPLTVNLIHNAMAKAILGPDYGITIVNKPLPFSRESTLKSLGTGQNLGTHLSLNMCFCMCFVSALYVMFVVKEAQSRAKLLQFVGGVRVLTFWTTHYLWDIVTFSITVTVMIITLAIYQEDGYSTFSELGRNFFLFILFGFSALPFTYLMSGLFIHPSSGFASLSLINTFCGNALFIIVFVMRYKAFDIEHIANALEKILMVYPHFSLAQGLNKLYTNYELRRACGPLMDTIPDEIRCQLVPDCCEMQDFFAWESPGVLREVIYLIVTSIVFFILVILIEYRIFSDYWLECRNKSLKMPPPPEDGYFDEDVEHEKQRIVNMSKDEIKNHNLVIDRVTKFYQHFVAVNQISVGIEHSECFGLLGVNGAGKTTTFKMLTGDERISSGDAYVKGHSLKTNMNMVYKDIGYCPQFDAIIEDFTGCEVLRIFGLIRGIPEAKIPVISTELAKRFGFMKHYNKQVQAYSGGNKRKLSTALAVIGNPAVVYLDEPTTGMDPASRRQLWNMVCKIRDAGKSIVLTSHSMEECEALCTRLAIMVNGEFKCIGSTQHLKNKFTKGLILKIKMKRSALDHTRSFITYASFIYDKNSPERAEQTDLLHEDIQKVRAFVSKEFPDAFLQEHFQRLLTFHIPIHTIKWSKIFGLMEKNKNALNIEDYSISQTTLEEIFLQFARLQREDPREFKREAEGIFKKIVKMFQSGRKS